MNATAATPYFLGLGLWVLFCLLIFSLLRKNKAARKGTPRQAQPRQQYAAQFRPEDLDPFVVRDPRMEREILEAYYRSQAARGGRK